MAKHHESGPVAEFVTNTEDQVFAITGLSGMVGAVMARYSRTQTGLRETLMREFVAQDQLKVSRADRLIEKVLIAYGDDSVGELEGAHLSMEGISLLATKVIEHRRIGGSPIEQSTRYVRFDFKDEKGRYAYVRPPVGSLAGQRAVFERHMDQIFEQYTAMFDPLYEHLKRRKPMDAARYNVRERGEEPYSAMQTERERRNFEKTYRADLKTKTCDILRAFLPLATRANVGLFGNGRYFQNLISKLLSSTLAEAQVLGEKAFRELSKVIPHYVKRAKRMDYAVANEENMRALVKTMFPNLAESVDHGVVMVEPEYTWMAEQLASNSLDRTQVAHVYRDEMELSFVTGLVYPFVEAPFERIRQALKALPREAWERIADTYYGHRETRRDRPERGIEFGYPHIFDMVTEWAVYKDLMRHRMGTILVQRLDPDLGFEMPAELEEARLTHLGSRCLETAHKLFAHLDAHAPQAAEYAFLQGQKMRWLLGMNDRALMHLLELRTGVQGHPQYRKVCQQMHQLLAERFPGRAARMQFVNHDEVFWSRGEAEARQRVKEERLSSDSIEA